MNCSEFREMLGVGLDWPERARRSLHAWRCRPCRVRAAEGRHMRDALRSLPRWAALEDRAERLARMVHASGGGGDTEDGPITRRQAWVGRRATKARWTVREALVAVGVLAILCAILFPAVGVVRARLGARDPEQAGSRRWHYNQLSHCALHLQYMAPAMLEYARDHGGRLPDAANWQAAILPYLGKAAAELHEPPEELVRCPAWRTDAYSPDVPVGNGEYSYRMAPELSGRLVQSVPDPARQPLLYDASADGTFVARHLLQMEVETLDATGPHRQVQEWPMALIAYLDGRLDMLPADEHRVVKELPWEEPARERRVRPARGGDHPVGAAHTVVVAPEDLAWKPRPTPAPGWRKEGQSPAPAQDER